MFLEGGNSVLGARVFNSLVNGAALINKSYHKHRESYRINTGLSFFWS